MVDTSVQPHKPSTNNDIAGQFPAIIGILSVLSYPVFSLIWEMQPIGLGKYIGLIAIFGLIFFLLLQIGIRWAETIHVLSVLYINLVMPCFFVIASIAMLGALSGREYGLALIVVNVLSVILWLIARKYFPGMSLFNQINRNILNVLPFGYGVIFWIWIYRTYDILQPKFWTAWRVVPLVLFLVLFCLWMIDLWRTRSRSRYSWMIYLGTGLLLIGLVYRPELFVDRHHYNFFMAPLNDVFHDKVLFVNTTSQYGVGVIYALAVMFRILHLPVGYEGLSFILALLFILQYLTLAAILWGTTQDLTLGVAGLLVMVYFNYLSVLWPSMLRTPAQSPLRYGLIYLVLWTALINTKTSSRYLRILEYILVGIANIWSLETFLYTVISLNAFYFIGDVLFATQFRAGLKTFAKRLAFQVIAVTVSWGVLLMFTRLVSGSFPNLQMYLEYFQAYGVIPYDGGPIAPHIFITGAVMFVYLFSIFFVLFDRFRQVRFLSASMASMLVGMSVAGLLQYVYYFVYYIDFHLSLLSIPLIFVLALWMAIIRRHVSIAFPFRVSTFAALIISLTMSMIVTAPSFYEKFSKSMLFVSLIEKQSVVPTNPYRVIPSDRSIKVLVDLIQKYAAGEKQIAIFVSPDDQTEALLLTGKTDLLGISEPGMSSISPTYSAFVLNQAQMIAGQPRYIFYEIEKNDWVPLQKEAYQFLVEPSKYIIIDKRRNYVVLERID